MKHSTFINTLLLALLTGFSTSSAEELPSPESPDEVPETLEWSFWFPSGVKSVNGDAVDLSALEGKMVGIYFSAHWCPPCRQFTPALVDFYNKHKDELEIVFVSGDRSPAQKERYIKDDKMEWLTVDFRGEDSDRLQGGLGVQQYPTLVILNDAGKIVTMDGYRQLAQMPDKVWEMWSAYLSTETASL